MQIKGTQKRMIAVKTADSNIFEEAYFVLRANIDKSSDDIIAEAERIIKSNERDEKNGAHSDGVTVKTVLFSVGGFLVGMMLTAICMILL